MRKINTQFKSFFFFFVIFFKKQIQGKSKFGYRLWQVQAKVQWPADPTCGQISAFCPKYLVLNIPNSIPLEGLHVFPLAPIHSTNDFVVSKFHNRIQWPIKIYHTSTLYLSLRDIFLCDYYWIHLLEPVFCIIFLQFLFLFHLFHLWLLFDLTILTSWLVQEYHFQSL